jgi:DNA-binding transcriptional MerR regulator
MLIYVNVKVIYNPPMQTSLQKTYSITELSKEFGITTRSIRHYEQERLIAPQRVGSQRVYNKGDRVRLQLILRGKRIGFSLAEIREIITMYDSPSGEQKQAELLLNKIQQRRKELAQQQKDIKTMLVELSQLEDRLINQ